MPGVTPTDTTTAVTDEVETALQETMSSGMFNIMATQFQNAIGDVSSAFSDDSSDPDAIG